MPKFRTRAFIVALVAALPLQVSFASMSHAVPTYSGTGNSQEFSLQTCLEKGLKHFQANEFGTAIFYFDQAKMLAPERADIQYYLGSCHDHTGDRTNAKRFYDKCTELDPGGTFGSAAATARRSMMRRSTAVPEPKLTSLVPTVPSNYIPRPGTYPGAIFPPGGNMGPPPSFGAWPRSNNTSGLGRNNNAGSIDSPIWPPLEYKPGSTSASSDKAKELNEKVNKQIQQLKDEQLARHRHGHEEQPVKPLSTKEKLDSVVSESDKRDKHFSRTLELLHRETQIEADNAKLIGDAGSSDVKLTARLERERIEQLLREELAHLDSQMQAQLRAGNVADAHATKAMADWIKRRAERELSNASEVGDFKAKAYSNWRNLRQQSISDSACNLLTQIRSQKQRGGFGLRSVGTNLYTRQYGVPEALLPPVRPGIARVFPAGSPYDMPPNFIIPEDEPKFQKPNQEVHGAILKSGPTGERLP